MTDIPLQGDLADALPQILPKLRGKTREGWLLVGLAGVVCLVGAIWVLQAGQPGTGHYAFLAGIVFLGIAAAVRDKVRRKHEAMLMPLLAKSIGLDYSQNGAAFVKMLPQRLLPEIGRSLCSDLVTGRVGGREVQFGEVECATTGKHKQVLFRGIVARFPNKAPMPAFFLANEKFIGRWGFSSKGLSVEGLERVASKQDATGKIFGIWCSSAAMAQHPALNAVVQQFLDLPGQLTSGAELFSATCNGEEIHLALSHRRDLFKLGGMFASEDALVPQISQAYQDLTLPMKLAARLLEVEALADKAAGVQAPAAP